MACTIVGIGAEGRRHLGGFEHTETAAGAGADKDDSAAFAECLREHVGAKGDAIALALHRRQHLAVFGQHQVDDVQRRAVCRYRGWRD